MYVKDHMTKNPKCIAKDTSISTALDLMAQNDFHRLPITDKDGKLIGLVTEGLISDSSGSKQTSLSIYELNYLLSRTNVSDIMIKDVITISPDAIIEEAANKMLLNHINVLPVVDEENTVIGIITENDIFRAFMDLLGYYARGTRFVVSVPEDKPGILQQLSKIFANENLSVNRMNVYHSERGIEVMVIADEECASMKEKLELSGFDVTDVRNH